jgi:hypothetical protein
MFRHRRLLAAIVVGILVVTMILSVTLYYANL